MSFKRILANLCNSKRAGGNSSSPTATPLVQPTRSFSDTDASVSVSSSPIALSAKSAVSFSVSSSESELAVVTPQDVKVKQVKFPELALARLALGSLSALLSPNSGMVFSRTYYGAAHHRMVSVLSSINHVLGQLFPQARGVNKDMSLREEMQLIINLAQEHHVFAGENILSAASGLLEAYVMRAEKADMSVSMEDVSLAATSDNAAPMSTTRMSLSA